MPNSYPKLRKKTVAKLFWRMVFLALAVAGTAMPTSAQDGHCSHPNDTLAPSELNRSDYRTLQQSVQEMRRIWHRMKCGNETPISIDRDCCISWCEQLTSFFSQASS
ncbi:uncharacterized protein [Pocillopora verrucosa]|uniref:uncharacterized protein n=1 Tax=Pocillopora verrucosa TaxID=203993 RepID=UPI00333F9FA4